MSEKEPTTTEAEEALEFIHNSQQDLLSGYMPSVFIRLAVSISFGAIFFGYGMMEHENSWALLIWIGAFSFAMLYSLYIYSYRLQGIKIRILPNSSKSEKIELYAAFGFAFLGFGSRFFRTNLGFELAPYFCSIIAATIFFCVLSKYPIGDIEVKDS